LPIGDIQRVFRMPRLGQTQMKQRPTGGPHQGRDLCATVAMFPMRAPATDDLIRPGTAFDQQGVVRRAHRIRGRPHLFGIGVAPGKDVHDPKRSEPQGARAAFTAFDGRVVLHLGRRRGVQHDKQRLAPCRAPDPGQRIAIGLAVGIDSGGQGVALLKLTRDHAGFVAAPSPLGKGTGCGSCPKGQN